MRSVSAARRIRNNSNASRDPDAMTKVGSPKLTVVSGAASAPPVIDVQGLGKVFFVNGNALTVFDGLSCSIEKGSFLSIVGPSGCGKSTLLKLISGLELPTKGC